jgi:predicted nucleotidyltransferase
LSTLLDLPAAVGGYIDELVSVLAERTDLVAAYLLGSAAYGGYEQGRSDVDVIAVMSGALSLDEKQELVAAIEELECPARKLELVVYSRDEAARETPSFELNLNTGESVAFTPGEESPHWFALDRAVAEKHALALRGPEWSVLFVPVPREQLLEAFATALEWQERDDPLGRSSLLNACRIWMWLDTGEVVTKQEAAAWLRNRVREKLEVAE